LTIGTSSDTTSADGISFGGDTSLFRSASGTLNLQGTGSTVTLQAASVSGSNLTGTNLTLAAGAGTGAGSSGNINLQIAPSSGINQNFINGARGGSQAVTVSNSNIYWVNGGYDTIGEANINGSSPNQSFITGATNPEYGIAVNSSNIFWTSNTGSTIGEANINGTSINNSFVTGVSIPRGVAVNGSNIFWVNGGTNTIGEANLNGSSPSQTFVTNAGNQLIGIAASSSNIYWGDETYGNISAIGQATLGTTAGTPITVLSLAGASGAALFQNAANSTSAFEIQNQTGTSNLFDADTTDTRIGIGTTTPSQTLDVAGTTLLQTTTNSTTGFQIQNAAGTALLTEDTTTGNLTVSQGNFTVGTSLANPSAPTLTTATTGGSLAANTYAYQVAATNASGTSAAVRSNPVSITTTGSTSVNTLTWTAVPGATGYVVYRQMGSSNIGWDSNTVSSSTTSITDNGTNYTWATITAPPILNTTGGGYINTANTYQINGLTVLQTPSATDTFVGISSGSSSVTGGYDTALGYQALASATNGAYNVAIGAKALQNATSPIDNTAVGQAALTSLTTGSYNTALGTGAGTTGIGSDTTGTNNTFLGYDATPGQSAYQVSNSSAIGTNSTVNQSNAVILGCTNGVNSCTATSTVGIGSQYAPNALTVSPGTYGTNGTAGASSTITQAGTAITGSGTTFTNNMSGGTIYYSDGTTATITYVSATSLTSSVSKSVAANSTYTIVYGGFNVTSTGAVLLQPTTNITTAFQILQAASQTPLFDADTTDNTINIGTGPQTGSKLYVSTSSLVGETISQAGSGDILDLQQSGTNVVSVSSTGSTIFKNST
jgi:hypothetical protein